MYLNNFGHLIVLLTIPVVSAIHCYSCESIYESGCAENFIPENYFKLDCSRTAPPRYMENDLAFRNASACMKKIYKENGVKKIVRSCFFGEANDTSVGCRTDPSLLLVEEQGCFVCEDESYCNDSRRGTGVGWIMTSALCLLTFIRIAAIN